MTAAAQLPDLHDAILTDCHCDWRAGTVRLRFSGSPYGPQGPFVIIWYEASELRVARSQPWGPSRSVLQAFERDGGMWIVAMQSGDEITVSGLQPALHLDSGRRWVRLEQSSTERLLEALCVELGFCLGADAAARLIADPPPDPIAFAEAVIVADGLDPHAMDRRVYYQVVRAVENVFTSAGAGA